MTLDDYCRMRLPGSRWRRGARRAIVGVIEASGDVGPEALLAAVDHAYPFGERRYEPYKGWLKERKLFREALAGGREALPDQDELAACEVARDAVIEGCLDLARQLLEQAPNRHARACPVCGVTSGVPCREPVPMTPDESVMPNNSYAGAVSQMHVWQPLLVPHVARLVGYRDAGPLFGGAA